MKVTVGADSAHRSVRKSSLAASVGADQHVPMAKQRAAKKFAMAAQVGATEGMSGLQFAPGGGYVDGPSGTIAGCSPSGCEEPMDPRVLRSVMQAQQGAITPPPPGTNFDPAQWAAIVGMINATKYCPSPRRVGWQQSSLTFQSLAVPDGNTVTVNLTPGQAFCMNALVAAQGSSLDIAFTIDSLVYLGIEYVTNGPWFSLFYTATAACCLCVRELPIIDPNSTVTMSLTNDQGEAADLRVQVFGEELFC